MERIWELFGQLNAFAEGATDSKTYQELRLLTERLLDRIDQTVELDQREQKESVAFFRDAPVSTPPSFGQCGDKVYWKIIDEVLYIGGSGPMWNFDNSPADLHRTDVYSPWIRSQFHTVVILNGVTTIGSDAFHGAELSGVIIPHSLKTVGELAFFDARIERLTLPNTLETVEEGIITGFRRVVDTLEASADIANIKPYAFFNRDDIPASTVYLTGDLPEDLNPLVASALFDGIGRYKVYYPEEWDANAPPFPERLSEKLNDPDGSLFERLKDALIPYRV